ncbi:gamma-glutamylputrescine oxidase [Mycobacterium frederiksbergense]|uniref:Gamma-glutamylputrescine oxidase n=1 Tax=Mycolicibacterium frederiksbergense TaxID=117567 RepID=A0ABT6L896_9MYCO|nr:FAD-dependent oxidoreductase [Mycolicibacterium frederiksbergense]MDH6198200.1 gamma-glutamylputrescine oxidase [Mycolicibacterium frederiksbergense]
MTVGWDVDPVVAAWSGLPKVNGDMTADVCVVGLGGSGLAAVADLVDRGLSVVGLDAGRVGAGAAGRNGGFLLAGPSEFLHRSVQSRGESSIDLYRATLAEIDRLGEMLGPEVIRRSGSIRLAGLPGEPVDAADIADRESDLADCVSLTRVLRENGIAVEEYDGDLGRGIFLPDDAAMNPARRSLGMAAMLAPRAALFEHSPAVRITTGTVHTQSGRVSAPIILVAIDGKLELALPELRGRVRTARLQMLSTHPVSPGRLPCPVYCRWGYDYAQQDSDGRMYVGGGRDVFLSSEWTPETTPTRDVQRYIEDVALRMAGAPVTVSSRWAASVGYSADGRPLCSEVAPGVVAFGGYNGTGNLVGPLAARAAVAMAIDGAKVPAYFCE